MDKEFFERLLYEEESATLDFKKEQYRFVRATDDEKSEILKDILGFANAWRRSEAYILIGVEDVRGGQCNIVGIPPSDHLNDHSLQQFVNNLTSQPVRFHYEAFGIEGKQVGIIHIEQQTRPIYLKRDYGRLLKEKVYVRRGSSTDPSKPATLEEIAQMRVGTTQPAAELLVEFSHIDRDDSLGIELSLESEYCKMPAKETIPDLSPSGSGPFGIAFMEPGLNTNFYRELSDFEFMNRLFKPLRLVVNNIGQVVSNNVRIEITVSKNNGVSIIDSSDLPERPTQRKDLLSSYITNRIKTNSNYPGEVEIAENFERFRLEINCGDLQPGRRVWSDNFYIGITYSREVSLSGFIFADNLPQPKDFSLKINAVIDQTRMSIEDLYSCAKYVIQDD